MEAVTLYHMVIEGMLALTGQHFILEYNEEQGTLPGFVEGFNNVARDEHRHVAFGARFLREMAQADARYARGNHAHAGRGGPDRRRRAAPRSGTWRARRAVRHRHRGDARLRGKGAGAPPQGDRPGASRLSWLKGQTP